MSVDTGGGAVLEHLDEAECLRLIAPGGVGRIAYLGRYGLTVLPVNYALHAGTIMFRTARMKFCPLLVDKRWGLHFQMGSQ